MPTGAFHSGVTHCPDTIGPGARSLLAGAVAEVAPDWVVDLHHDPEGQETIIIQPEDEDDAVGLTLIVHADQAMFHIDEWRRDVWGKVGEFRAWADVVRTIRLKLLWEMTPPPTLH